MLVAARSGVRTRPDVSTRALARVRQPLCAQTLERPLVKCGSLALPRQLSVGRKAEPREIFQDRRLVFRAAPGAIVILDPHEHTRIGSARTRDLPHVYGVE